MYHYVEWYACAQQINIYMQLHRNTCQGAQWTTGQYAILSSGIFNPWPITPKTMLESVEIIWVNLFITKY